MPKNNYISSNQANMKEIRALMKRLPEAQAIEQIGNMDSLDSYPYILDILEDIHRTLLSKHDQRYQTAIYAIEETQKIMNKVDKIQRLNKFLQVLEAVNVEELIPDFKSLVENIKNLDYSDDMKEVLKELRIWFHGAYVQGGISESKDSEWAAAFYRKLTGGYNKSDLIIYFLDAANELKKLEDQHNLHSSQHPSQQPFYNSSMMQREGTFGHMQQPAQGGYHSTAHRPKI